MPKGVTFTALDGNVIRRRLAFSPTRLGFNKEAKNLCLSLELLF
jgi:hypothetical protein